MNRDVMLAELENVIEHQRRALEYLELLYDTIEHGETEEYTTSVLIQLVRRRNGILD